MKALEKFIKLLIFHEINRKQETKDWDLTGILFDWDLPLTGQHISMFSGHLVLD